MKPMFSGHETFPLRQLWLKKAYHQVFKFYEADSDYAPKTVFQLLTLLSDLVLVRIWLRLLNIGH